MTTPASLEPLAEVVAARVLLDAIEASRRLTALQVPHALIGGLAVGLLGHPRATRDVDILVADSAFEHVTPVVVFRVELRDLVRVGVIDLMPLPVDHPELAADLRVPANDEIPVVSPEALVLLKLRADRPQDRADIAALIGAGLNVANTTAYLRRYAPELVPRLSRILTDAV